MAIRNASKIADLAAKGADIVTLDVTAPLPELQKIAKEANDRYRFVTHLVNLAGYLLAGVVEETF